MCIRDRVSTQSTWGNQKRRKPQRGDPVKALYIDMLSNKTLVLLAAVLVLSTAFRLRGTMNLDMTPTTQYDISFSNRDISFFTEMLTDHDDDGDDIDAPTDEEKEENLKRVKLMLKENMMEHWELVHQNLTFVDFIEANMKEAIVEEPDRWNELMGDCEDQFSIFLQLMYEAYERSWEFFDKAWDKTFSQTFDEVMGGKIDDVLEDAVEAILKNIYNTSLEELGIDWKEALFRITHAMDEFDYGTLEDAQGGDKKDNGDAGDAAVAAFVEAQDEEPLMLADTVLLQTREAEKAENGEGDGPDEKADVLNKLPEGVTPEKVAGVFLDEINERLEGNLKEQWAEVWDSHYNENIAENEEFLAELKELMMEAYRDESFVPECKPLTAPPAGGDDQSRDGIACCTQLKRISAVFLSLIHI
eukprot:TRINITY_DN439_c0_g1_i8.p1 TRINITY_DN439_c0_g1~~TRINITY_DN439_c0_g1_i8.p1  ORF type:complete len:416 (-),score=118.25 TRINITY_DN439_c0_g1_i8:62-1309(-)